MRATPFDSGPLGTTLVARSGLTPEGPWSAATPIATCDLADSDMFCVGVHLHPSLDGSEGSVVVSAWIRKRGARTTYSNGFSRNAPSSIAISSVLDVP